MLYVFAAALAAAAVALDQITKYLTVTHIALGGQVSLLPGVLHLTYVQNTGAAFSIFQGQRWPLIVLTIVVLALIVFALVRRYVTHPFGVLALSAVSGGAIGNLIDRVRLGHVVDMIEVEFMNFAVFNVADIFVTCGGIALCVYIAFFYSRDEKKRRAGDDFHDDSV